VKVRGVGDERIWDLRGIGLIGCDNELSAGHL
jgi:hypothetical protein